MCVYPLKRAHHFYVDKSMFVELFIKAVVFEMTNLPPDLPCVVQVRMWMFKGYTGRAGVEQDCISFPLNNSNPCRMTKFFTAINLVVTAVMDVAVMTASNNLYI